MPSAGVQGRSACIRLAVRERSDSSAVGQAMLALVGQSVEQRPGLAFWRPSISGRPSPSGAPLSRCAPRRTHGDRFVRPRYASGGRRARHSARELIVPSASAGSTAIERAAVATGAVRPALRDHQSQMGRECSGAGACDVGAVVLASDRTDHAARRRRGSGHPSGPTSAVTRSTRPRRCARCLAADAERVPLSTSLSPAAPADHADASRHLCEPITGHRTRRGTVRRAVSGSDRTRRGCASVRRARATGSIAADASANGPVVTSVLHDLEPDRASATCPYGPTLCTSDVRICRDERSYPSLDMPVAPPVARRGAGRGHGRRGRGMLGGSGSSIRLVPVRSRR